MVEMDSRSSGSCDLLPDEVIDPARLAWPGGFHGVDFLGDELAAGLAVVPAEQVAFALKGDGGIW